MVAEIWTGPAASAGVVQLIEVELVTLSPVQAVDPKSTVVTPVKLVPVIVTEVPPLVEPVVGLNDVMAGAGAKVY